MIVYEECRTYTRMCKRCEKLFKTPHRKGKICDKCNKRNRIIRSIIP